MAKSRKQKSADSRQRFVLDCSLVLAWYFADESDEYADRVALALADCDAVVPSVWTLEIANALVVGERRGRATPAQTAAFLARLSKLPITVDELTAPMAWTGALPLAREHQLSVYDATYVELAIREGLSIGTLDRRLKAALPTIGVATFEP